MRTSRILLALTNGVESRLCARILKAQDLEVDQASDGVEAMVKALSTPFTAIVGAADLPMIGGQELCRILRQDLWTREVPFILTSAEPAMPSTLIIVDAVVEAPVDPGLLCESIRQVLIGSGDQGPEGSPNRGASRKHRPGRTVNPPIVPPGLICPRCDRQLVYLYSQLGGINERSVEQWDYFDCRRACGTFQYRHRTRSIRAVTTTPESNTLVDPSLD